MKSYDKGMISAILDVFDYAGDGIAIIDFDKNEIIYCNRQWAGMSGMDENRDYRGASILEFQREDNRYLFHEFKEALEKDDQVIKRISTNMPDGKPHTLDVRVNLVRSISPRLSVVIMRDVTEYVRNREELKRHQENLSRIVEQRTERLNKLNQTLQEEVVEHRRVLDKLRASEESSKALYKNIPLPTFTWLREGDDFRLADYNDAASEITSGRISEYVGITASRLYNDQPSILHDLEKCYSEKVNIDREVEYHYVSTGRDKHLAVKYAFVPPDMVLVHTEDITERKQNEEEIKKYREHLEKLVDERTSRLKDRNRELNLLNQINRTIISRDKPGRSLTSMMKLLADFFNAGHTTLYRLDSLNGGVALLASTGIHKRGGEKAGDEFVSAGDVIKSLEEGKGGERLPPELIYHERFSKVLRREGIESSIVFPSGVGERKNYLVIFDLLRGEDIPAESTGIMEAVGEQIEIALERMELMEELERREKELKELTSNLFDRIEEDRKKMAMNLHDDMVQSLISLNLEFDMLREKLSPDEKKEHSIRVIREQLKRITNNTRMYSYQLRPPMLDDLGLIPAIRSYAGRIEEGNRIRVEVQAAGFDVELPVQIALTIYRVVQEALTNAVRHSGASKVSVRLTKGYPRVIIVIEDNGSGFSAERDGTIPGGLGIIGMRERVEMWGGDFNMRSPRPCEGGGTRIRFTLPLEV